MTTGYIYDLYIYIYYFTPFPVYLKVLSTIITLSMNMASLICFESPLGFFGNIFNKLSLTDYMKKFIGKRNDVIKQPAEIDAYRKFIDK